MFLVFTVITGDVHLPHNYPVRALHASAKQPPTNSNRKTYNKIGYKKQQQMMTKNKIHRLERKREIVTCLSLRMFFSLYCFVSVKQTPCRPKSWPTVRWRRVVDVYLNMSARWTQHTSVFWTFDHELQFVSSGCTRRYRRICGRLRLQGWSLQ